MSADPKPSLQQRDTCFWQGIHIYKTLNFWLMSLPLVPEVYEPEAHLQFETARSPFLQTEPLLPGEKSAIM
jgi:hypothetical protein